MTGRDCLKRFFTQVVHAGAVWFLVLLIAETLLPGSVAPFINLAVAGLLVLTACIFAILL